MRPNNRSRYFIPIATCLVLGALFISSTSYGSFESSLIGIKTKLTTIILPLIAVIGLVCASFSLYTGNPNAKQHIVYAIFASIIGFGAQAIIDLISQTVR